MRIQVCALAVATLGLACARDGATAQWAASRLRVNGMGAAALSSAPLPLDRAVWLAWAPEGGSGAGPAGFEVEVADECTPLAREAVHDVPTNGSMAVDAGACPSPMHWQSGRVNGTASLLVLPPSLVALLAPGLGYQWRVRLISSLDGPGPWSAVLAFDTAPTAAVWAAGEWIGGGSELRADWALPAGRRVVRARAYVSGLGAFALHINGEKVGDHILDPGESVYDMKALYLGWNVTGLLQPGASNAIGARVGNSKWGYLDEYTNRTAVGDQSGDSTRALLLVITATLDTGEVMTLGSTPAAWRSRHGPIVYDHLWHGEIYDQRQEATPAWDAAPLSTYPPGTWAPAVPMRPRVGRLFPQLMEGVRVTETFEPAAVHNRTTTCAAPVLGGVATEGETLFLGCQGGVGHIEAVTFANYGAPQMGDAADCSEMAAGSCGVGATAVVNKLCVGRSSCEIRASTAVFGGTDPCPDVLKTLAIRATGSPDCRAAAPPPAAHANTSLVFDFGRNMAGLATFTIGTAATRRALGEGAVVKLTFEHTEITGPDGQVQNNYFPGMEFGHASKTCSMVDWYQRKWYECANQTDAYVFNTSTVAASAVYRPTFTYHGFRFIQVRAVQLLPNGTSQALSAAASPSVAIVAHRAHSDIERLADVRLRGAGAGIIGDVFNATLASHVSNVWTIPTDCPQREKRGWMGDAGITSSSLQTFYDALAFHTNFLRLIADNQNKTCLVQPHTSIYGPCSASQNLNGSVPDVTPFCTGPYGGNPGTTDWQVAYVIIARNLLVHYGEQAVPVLSELWPGLEAFMEYLERSVDKATGLLLTGARGDWVPPPNQPYPTPTPPIAAFWHTLCVGYMAEIASALGRSADAERYTQRLAANRVAYHNKFYNHAASASSDGRDGVRCCYDKGSQTSNLFALHLGATPDHLVNQTVAMLVASIYNRAAPNPPAPSGRLGSASAVPWGSGAHMDCGIFGTTFMFEVLHAQGHDAAAWDIIKNSEYPSLGYMLAQNATTLWEGWDASSLGMSHNHIMFGGGVNRFIAAGLGLAVETGLSVPASGSNATARAGWRRVVVQPSPAALRSLDEASVSRRSGEGLATVVWSRTEDLRIRLNLTLPANGAACVDIPLLADGHGAALGACVVACSRTPGGVATAASVVACRELAPACRLRLDGELVVRFNNVRRSSAVPLSFSTLPVPAQ